MTGPARTIALIGATSGLGRAAADQLAKQGHNLILVGRDPQRALRLAEQLPGAVVIGADVSTSAGVDRAASQIGDAADHLDALVNNAGVMMPARQTTSEGAELNFAVHHLAPYSMTSKLLPLLARGAGRVVNVNSEGHRAPLFGGGAVRIDVDDLDGSHGYDPFVAYSRTKLANLLFTSELQRHLDAVGSPLRALTAHPGYSHTNLQGATGRKLGDALMSAVTRIVATDADFGARQTLYATSVDLPGNTFVGPRFGQVGRTQPVRRSRAAHNATTAAALWELSEQLTATKFPL